MDVFVECRTNISVNVSFITKLFDTRKKCNRQSVKNTSDMPAFVGRLQYNYCNIKL